MGVQEEKKSLNDQLKELQARADQGLVQYYRLSLVIYDDRVYD